MAVREGTELVVDGSRGVGLRDKQGNRDRKKRNKCIGLEMKLRNRADEENRESGEADGGPLILGASGHGRDGVACKSPATGKTMR